MSGWRRGRAGDLIGFGILLAGCLWGTPAHTGDPARGYQFLTEKPYLPADFDEEAFAEVWRVWPEPLRSQAEQATPIERRRMAFARYGLTTRPGVDLQTTTDEHFAPLQYVVSSTGQWTMNCFTCHGGQLLGQTVPGLPNNRVSLQTLNEELRDLKLKLHPERPLVRMERASAVVPLGTTRGTTNAVMFGVILLSMRDADLNVRLPTKLPRLVHHDMDAPAWWYYKKKSHLYADSYAVRNHRALMQFMLVRSNGPEKFREWESDFEDVAAYLESLESPKYPFAVDQALASRGEHIFQRTCAECHGTYGAQETYPNRNVAIDEIGTDRIRFDSILPEDRAMYGQSWFGEYGKQETAPDAAGYIAPPLDGVWASAPYFHNGSVPTLWHVLHSDQRPVVWKRTNEQEYDQSRGGLLVEELPRIPLEVTSPSEIREYFDTQRYGKSAAGHHFSDALSEEEKNAVLEYLKTL